MRVVLPRACVGIDHEWDEQKESLLDAGVRGGG